jgi:hypothetical protein
MTLIGVVINPSIGQAVLADDNKYVCFLIVILIGHFVEHVYM